MTATTRSARALDSAKRWGVTSGVLAFLATPRLRTDPHRPYQALLKLDRVHRSPLGIWVLSGHQEVAAALRHPALGSDESKADLSAIRPAWAIKRLAPATPGPFHDLIPNLILFRDPPDHSRLRSLVNKAFTPKAVADLEQRIAQVVDDRLDRLAPKGRMDLLGDFAYPVPALIICELLGVPSGDHPFITAHAPALAARLDPSIFRSAATIAAADNATDELARYLTNLTDERRRTPRDDLLSALIAAQDGTDRLSHDELVTMAIFLLIAGHETTANLLGNGVFALLRHPDQLQRLRDDRSLDHTAIEELLRYDGPVQMAERITLDDVEICGNHIPKGRIIALCIAAANRDLAVFAEPEQLDVGRTPNPHLAFGSGAHFCIGAPLARMEARIMLRALLERLPELALADTKTRWRPSFTIRGLHQLDLRWRPKRQPMWDPTNQGQPTDCIQADADFRSRS
jgi:cytochrome P450